MCVWCWLAAAVAAESIRMHISTDQIRHLVLLFNSSSSRLTEFLNVVGTNRTTEMM